MDTQGEKKMYEGNWKCSGCGGAITQLPFEPDPAREGELVCRECHSAKQQQKGERKMYEGNWKCSGCGGAITQLPFEPHPDRQDTLKCRNCYSK